MKEAVTGGPDPVSAPEGQRFSLIFAAFPTRLRR
jgi:hypothetical protein